MYDTRVIKLSLKNDFLWSFKCLKDIKFGYSRLNNPYSEYLDTVQIP